MVSEIANNSHDNLFPMGLQPEGGGGALTLEDGRELLPNSHCVLAHVDPFGSLFQSQIDLIDPLFLHVICCCLVPRIT